MNRFALLTEKNAPENSQELLGQIRNKLGTLPNIFKSMAASPAVLQAYLGISGALNERGKLPQVLREKIALAVAEMNECRYCLAAHSFLGKKAGLSPAEILESRRGESTNPKEAAALSFARILITKKGYASDEEIKVLKENGYSDAEILEILAVVILNLFTNYFNHLAETPVDFPE